jgi:hypothetical protein
MILDLLQQYVVHVVLLVSAAGMIWWFTFRARSTPSIVRIDYRELDCERESWLFGNGYRYIGTYQINFGNPMTIVVNAYLSSDCVKACEIIRIGGRIVTEFTSRCIPFFVLCLNDFQGGSVVGYAPYKVVLHARTKSVEELSALHDRLLNECRLRNATPAPLPNGDGVFEELVVKGAQRDFEYQVRIGRMKRVGSNVYKPTLVGAVIGPSIVWFSGMKSVFTAILPWNDRRILKRLRAKLDSFWSYPQTDIDYKY